MNQSVGTEPAPSVLVVDDTPTNLSLLLEVLGNQGFTVLVAREGSGAIEQARYARPDLILLDVMMPGIDGFETCRRLKADPDTAPIPVIFMTALADTEDKLRGFEAGGADYIAKPFQHEEVLARVRTQLEVQRLQRGLAQANASLERKVQERTAELARAVEELQRLRNRLQNENVYLRQEISEHADHFRIVGDSPALRAALEQLDAVAGTPATVLIHGETGTGKELVARALHERSPRRERMLVKLNCAAISAGLVESELFGHVKGAFTGAADKRIGRFQLADGGTLFLDEVGELPLETQAKLLRVLQEGEFEPVGSSRTQQCDVRVIAATNRDLRNDVANGRFRADLFYRLNVFPLTLPPLRERPEDIVPLAGHFLERIARRLGRKPPRIPPRTREQLLGCAWPGNVRELHNVIERAAILSRGEELLIDWDLGAAPRVQAPSQPAKSEPADGPAADSLALDDVERAHFITVLRSTGGVIEGPRGAARLLNLSPSTARFRMRKLGITKRDYLVSSA